MWDETENFVKAFYLCLLLFALYIIAQFTDVWTPRFWDFLLYDFIAFFVFWVGFSIYEGIETYNHEYSVAELGSHNERERIRSAIDAQRESEYKEKQRFNYRLRKDIEIIRRETRTVSPSLSKEVADTSEQEIADAIALVLKNNARIRRRVEKCAKPGRRKK
jgi:hypothetical protein